MSISVVLMTVSAAVVLVVGVLHLVYTFFGPLLTPRDAALQARMREVSPVITRQTTMWRAWIGFNATHSMGLLLFALLYGCLALGHADLLFGSPYLLALGMTMLAGYLVLAKLYFFRAPLVACCIAFACFVAAIVVR